MEKITAVEILLVIGSFTKSFWLGIFVLGYMLYVKDEHRKTKNELYTTLMVNKNDKLWTLKFSCTANHFHSYKKCIIEQYNRMFSVVKPDGKRINKIFSNLEEAEKEINTTYFLFPEPKEK